MKSLLQTCISVVQWLLLGGLAGGAFWWRFGPISELPVLSVLHGLIEFTRRGGPVMIALLPLALWCIWLGIRRLFRPGGGDERWRSDLEFIARNGTTLGMLGTILALSSTGGFFSQADQTADRVLSLLPVLGEALLSTLAGLVISLAAEVIQHCDLRNSDNETD